MEGYQWLLIPLKIVLKWIILLVEQWTRSEVFKLPSVQFSSQLCTTLRPHGLQHARPLCPLPTHRVYSNSCPLSWWCHPNMAPSVIPFSSYLQTFPELGSFPISQFFTSGGQSITASGLASVLSINIQNWFSLGLTGLISLLSNGLLRVFSNTTVQKHRFFGAQILYGPTLTSIHDY